MTVKELAGKEQETAKALAALGFIQTDSYTFELQLADDLRWLVEFDYVGYTLNEWRETLQQWRPVADFFNGDFLVTTLEAIGART